MSHSRASESRALSVQLLWPNELSSKSLHLWLSSSHQPHCCNRGSGGGRTACINIPLAHALDILGDEWG